MNGYLNRLTKPDIGWRVEFAEIAFYRCAESNKREE